jgi:hypothetical protein
MRRIRGPGRRLVEEHPTGARKRRIYRPDAVIVLEISAQTG